MTDKEFNFKILSGEINVVDVDQMILDFKVKCNQIDNEQAKKDCELNAKLQVDLMMLNSRSYQFIEGKFIYKPTLFSRLADYLELFCKTYGIIK